MRVLLAVDRRFVADGSSWLTEGPIGPETGERYLNWFDSVTVVGREGQRADANAARLNRVAAPGLEIVCLPNLSGLNARLSNLQRVRRRLASLVDSSDCVIARLPGELSIEAAKIALARGKPVAFDIGGCTWDALRAHGSIKGKLYAPVSYWRMRALVRGSFWVSYVTQDFLQRRYPAALAASTVECSNVDIPQLDPGALEGRISRVSNPSPRLVFGTIGSLHTKYKGVQHALEALSIARPHLPPVEYRVLGGGDIAPWRALADKNGVGDIVRFDGALPSGEPVRQWLDKVDIYLQPSLTEGLPRSLIEAMSRGCPSIASFVGGIPELLPPECLHAPGDARALASLIRKAVDADWQRSQAEKNWNTARDYTAATLGRKRNEFWRGFANHVRSSAPLTP